MSAFFSWDTATNALAFGSLALLGLGYLTQGPRKHALRIAGWLAFGAYWPTQAQSFFLQDDPVNGYFTLLAPALFGYLAYHEYRSLRWGEDPKALRWIAGTAFIAGATYFLLYRIPPVTDFVIGMVAQQSAWLVTYGFGVPAQVVVEPGAAVESRYHIFLPQYGGDAYAVTIILACTAIQSIMIFVGAIATTEGAARANRWRAYAYVVPTIYLLNLFRNAGIVYGYKVQGILPFGPWEPGSYASFEFMHAWVGKTGSLAALVVIALLVFRALPELHQNVLDLLDLPRRRRPGYYQRAPAPEPAPALPPAPAPAPARPESE